MPSFPKLPRGRLRQNPPGHTTESLVLWPEQRARLMQWCQAFQCSRSEAVRMMMDAAGPASSPAATLAAQNHQALRERIRAAERVLRPESLVAERRRERQKLYARARRAKLKQ